MTITRNILESYLACRYKVHLQLTGEQGDRSDYERLLAEAKERAHSIVAEQLLARHEDNTVLQNVIATPDLLRQGHPLLLDAIVEGENFSICFDGLQRQPTPSGLGDHHYVPMLFHPGEKPGREQRSLLEILAVILAAVQAKAPAWGILIYGRSCQIRRLKLGAEAARAQRALQDIRDMQRTGTPPRLRLNAHCQVCPFQRRCLAQATAKDDLSLLRGIKEKELGKYARRGILTVTQLSFTFRARKRLAARQQKQIHSYPLQALAIREKKIHVLGTPQLPDSANRIYLDIEGDPDRGFDYLLGVIVVADGHEQRYSLWGNNSAEEPCLFEQLLELLGRHPDAWLYAYGSYEANFLRRVGKAAGKEEEAGRIVARLFNVLSVVHSHVYFPVYSNGLKDVAGYLGFTWSEPNASGVQSVVWRRRWEESGAAQWKEMLITYNLEDCAALRKVTEVLDAVCSCPSGPDGATSADGREVMHVEHSNPQGRMHGWIESIHGLPDFGYIHDRASFDYLRDRICVRTGKPLKKASGQRRIMGWKRNRRVSREVEISSPSCPSCGSSELTRHPNGSLARLAFDLHITRSAIKGKVIRYRTTWHHCASCGKRFVPPDYLRLEEFCHSLKSWAMYEHVAHRGSLPKIAETIRECFNLPICHTQVHAFKGLLAQYYDGTYKQLLHKILTGRLVHADETEIHLRHVGKAYVWVFTNLEEVVFLYRPSREGDFLKELFQHFQGVLVSDFYAAYDSLDCLQQKCLVHLLRDFNQDILANPWDEELKAVAGGFGAVLRTAVATIDQHGLKRKYLSRHKGEVDRFFADLATKSYNSEKAEGYQQRLLKCRDKLFTFLDHDGVPWHNNAAEHAVKSFVQYRKVADNLMSEAGLAPYLVLLSIQQTCKYKGVSFLRFLLSGETDIDVFRARRGKRVVPAIELYPDGDASSRPRRKRLQDGLSSS
jgi:predicted RecB family nuclease